MCRDVSDGGIQIVHDRHGQNVVEKFGIEVIRPGRRAGDERRRGGV